MARRKVGELSPEDRNFWARVQKTVRPMRQARAHPGEAHLPAPTRSETGEKPVPATAFRIGERAAPAVSPPAPSPIDRRAMARLKRGKVAPEARLDLHGMTQAQALPALTGFIMRATADGKRMVLVITGKGRDRDAGGPIPERPGILRHNLPHWLHGGQLAGLVLDAVPAHRSHGGDGAFYVYLRRRR